MVRLLAQGVTVKSLSWPNSAPHNLQEKTPPRRNSMIRFDPKNAGRQEKWWEKPVAGAKPTPAPWMVAQSGRQFFLAVSVHGFVLRRGPFGWLAVRNRTSRRISSCSSFSLGRCSL